ncbi:hypothetical protein NE237_019086 [Protea cynaroides]|uniref:Uncharacterized protein n=1 Tax=Protea cynaroides TaxID=273540 RepID=A0A9Q0KB72_9MAGN|nr:hypothetical protein NE237_019086 [Protea cynaroides]
MADEGVVTFKISSAHIDRAILVEKEPCKVEARGQVSSHPHKVFTAQDLVPETKSMTGSDRFWEIDGENKYVAEVSHVSRLGLGACLNNLARARWLGLSELSKLEVEPSLLGHSSWSIRGEVDEEFVFKFHPPWPFVLACLKGSGWVFRSSNFTLLGHLSRPIRGEVDKYFVFKFHPP